MLYMIIEKFKNGDATPVYSRFWKEGRLAPEGLEYIDSWVSEDLTKCFQLMRTDERDLMDQWIANWSDLVEFEVIPVLTSAEATDKC